MPVKNRRRAAEPVATLDEIDRALARLERRLQRLHDTIVAARKRENGNA